MRVWWIMAGAASLTVCVACPGEDAIFATAGPEEGGSGGALGGGGIGGQGGEQPDCTLGGGPCEACGEEQCASDVALCCETVGCFEVVECSVVYDCIGLDCYDASTCKETIDAYGGLAGPATINAAVVGDCLLRNCSEACGYSSEGGSGGAGGMGGAPPCGNGSIETGEECDDNNTASGDGCDNQCIVECNIGTKAPDNHCYHVGGTSMSRDNARAYCQALDPGWDLVGISRIQERDFVDAMVGNFEPFWTSGSDEAMEGTFVWLNGEMWTVDSGSLWLDEEPTMSASQNCVYLNGNFGGSNDQLGDAPCSNEYKPICELTPAGT